MADFWTSDNPDVGFVSYTQEADGDVAIVCSCVSSVSRDTKFPTLKYSINGGLTWNNCTKKVGEGEDFATGPITTSPGGTNHTFVWDADADLGTPSEATVVLKFGIKYFDDAGDEVLRESDPFYVDFAPPVCSVGWPNGEITSDSTPTLQRNASDSSPPIETQWELDDTPDCSSPTQTKGYSTDETWTVTALSTGVWYFRVKCRDAYSNESTWSTIGSFKVSTSILPYYITDGVDTVHPLVVTPLQMVLELEVKEYEADGTFDAGGANVVEVTSREPARVIIQCVDGTPYTNYNQLLTWYRAQTELDVEDEDNNDVGYGGGNIRYTPSGWKIVSITEIVKPSKTGLIWYEAVLEEV